MAKQLISLFIDTTKNTGKPEEKGTKGCLIAKRSLSELGLLEKHPSDVSKMKHANLEDLENPNNESQETTKPTFCEKN